MSAETLVTVNIRSIAFGGAGVGEVTAQLDGRTDLLGITAFVPFTTAGEQITARVVERKERHLQAELISVESPAPARTTPQCELFTQCGGCEFQHIDYQEQLALKFEMIRGSLRAAKLPSAVIDMLSPLVPSADYGYRRRITLHVDTSGKVGFYRSGSRAVVPVSKCPIAVPAINELLPGLADFGREVQGKISSILLEADDTGVVAVLKSPYDLSKQAARAIMTAAKGALPNAILFAGGKEIEGYGRQILELPLNEQQTLKLRVPAGFFSQVNAKINARLVGKAVEFAGLVHQRLVMDLYAGAGNFALPFASAGARVMAVECDKRLVSFGRENASRYGLQKNLEFSELSVEKFLALPGMRDQRPELLIADPPRSGLGKVAHDLPKARRMLLISCHLPSFVRDLKQLSDLGWKVGSIVPFDMFAQTSYVEILAEFSRNDVK